MEAAITGKFSMIPSLIKNKQTLAKGFIYHISGNNELHTERLEYHG